MELGYVLDSMVELGHLTPIEVGMVETHVGFNQWAARKFNEEYSLRTEEVVHEINRCWENATPYERERAVLAAWPQRERIFGFIGSNISGTMTALMMRNQLGSEDFDRDYIVNNFGISNAICNLLGEHLMQLGEEITQVDSAAVADLLSDSYNQRTMTQFEVLVDMVNQGFALPEPDDRTTITISNDFVRNRRDVTSARYSQRMPEKKGIWERAERKLISEGKRALKRAYNFFQDHDRGEELRLFVNSGSVEVSNKDSDLKFVLKRNVNNLIDRSIESKSSRAQWNNIDVEIFTKTNVFICGICVYIADTPVLDQLMGLIMMVEAGLEDDLIEKGNTKQVTQVSLSELAFNSPKLRAKLEARAKRLAEMPVVRPNINTTYIERAQDYYQLYDNTVRIITQTWCRTYGTVYRTDQMISDDFTETSTLSLT